ncbi:MAG: hypothetical protein LQ351_007266 [Letrouitia transgressa]|nr:MAG: hypothetical protein LQ351_007266 [Letrouitia transgressa]
MGMSQQRTVSKHDDDNDDDNDRRESSFVGLRWAGLIREAKRGSLLFQLWPKENTNAHLPQLNDAALPLLTILPHS